MHQSGERDLRDGSTPRSVTLVDAAQSAGHAPINVQELGCDFLVFSGHKCCGPTGIGVLYGNPELLADLEPYQFGGEMISRVTYESAEWKSGPHRFEAGTPHIAGAVGLASALDYLEKIGRPAIQAGDHHLGRRRLRKAFDSCREFEFWVRRPSEPAWSVSSWERFMPTISWPTPTSSG